MMMVMHTNKRGDDGDVYERLGDDCDVYGWVYLKASKRLTGRPGPTATKKMTILGTDLTPFLAA